MTEHTAVTSVRPQVAAGCTSTGITYIIMCTCVVSTSLAQENESTLSESEEENAASTSSDDKVDFEDILALQIDVAFPLGWRGLVTGRAKRSNTTF